MENNIEIIETNGYTVEHETETFRRLEHEIIISFNGRELTLIADIYAEIDKQEWYSDERGSAYEYNINDFDVDVLEVYEDGAEIKMCKTEIYEIETLLETELKRY